MSYQIKTFIKFKNLNVVVKHKIMIQVVKSTILNYLKVTYL